MEKGEGERKKPFLIGEEILFGERTHRSSTYWSLEREEEEGVAGQQRIFYLGDYLRTGEER